jgi:hypothetical protein
LQTQGKKDGDESRFEWTKGYEIESNPSVKPKTKQCEAFAYAFPSQPLTSAGKRLSFSIRLHAFEKATAPIRTTDLSIFAAFS